MPLSDTQCSQSSCKHCLRNSATLSVKQGGGGKVVSTLCKKHLFFQYYSLQIIIILTDPFISNPKIGAKLIPHESYTQNKQTDATEREKKSIILKSLHCHESNLIWFTKFHHPDDPSSLFSHC